MPRMFLQRKIIQPKCQLPQGEEALSYEDRAQGCWALGQVLVWNPFFKSMHYSHFIGKKAEARRGGTYFRPFVQKTRILSHWFPTIPVDLGETTQSLGWKKKSKFRVRKSGSGFSDLVFISFWRSPQYWLTPGPLLPRDASGAGRCLGEGWPRFQQRAPGAFWHPCPSLHKEQTWKEENRFLTLEKPGE